MSRTDFTAKRVQFFLTVHGSRYHTFWVADQGIEIISQLLGHEIDMVPRPSRLDDQFDYIPNNYTKPSLRGCGIASELLKHVVEWATLEDLELLIVYSSEQAGRFHVRAGFDTNNDASRS